VQWLADNHDELADNLDDVDVPEPSGASDTTLAAEEEHILRCLAAALIMQWNTLPAKLQEEPFGPGYGGAVGHGHPERTNRSLPAQAHGWRGRNGKIVSESEANSASPPPLTGITICCRLRSSTSAHLGAYRSPPAFIHVDVTQA
jgi:hypothetical protein